VVLSTRVCYLWLKCRRKDHSKSSTVRKCTQRGRLYGSAHCCSERIYSNGDSAYWYS